MKMSYIYLLTFCLSPLMTFDVRADDTLLQIAKESKVRLNKEDRERVEQIIDQNKIDIGKKIEKLKIDRISKDDAPWNTQCALDETFCNKKMCYMKRDLDNESNLKVFMTFKMHDRIWKDLDREMLKVNARFVIHGLPDKNLHSLIKKIDHLRKIGILSPIDLNPVDFDRYEVEVSPTFVVYKSANMLTVNNVADKKLNEDQFDIVSGNIELSYALEILAESGDLKESKNLYKTLMHHSGDIK